LAFVIIVDEEEEGAVGADCFKETVAEEAFFSGASVPFSKLFGSARSSKSFVLTLITLTLLSPPSTSPPPTDYY
jgi:hypothetical protein